MSTNKKKWVMICAHLLAHTFIKFEQCNKKIQTNENTFSKIKERKRKNRKQKRGKENKRKKEKN